jgi:hypothetical protein
MTSPSRGTNWPLINDKIKLQRAGERNEMKVVFILNIINKLCIQLGFADRQTNEPNIIYI